MKNYSVAIMIYGDMHSTKNAITEEKYKDLAIAFQQKGFNVSSVLYNDEEADVLSKELLAFDAILVWVNPVEQGRSRKRLDGLLNEVAGKGVFVSAHPEVILKMGTKDVLYKTRNNEFGGDIRMYQDQNAFEKDFLPGLKTTRILKQYRGNGGNGVFKIERLGDKIGVTHAAKGSDPQKTFTTEGFNDKFAEFFSEGGMLIDQPWNEHLTNGMVRCYLSGGKVAGFGYQEVNALYPGKDPGKRFYFSEDCGLFQDLRNIMEEKWVTELRMGTDVSEEMLPVIWDADFFINDVNTKETKEKYTLCEINVSSVSPFPPSAIPHIIRSVEQKLNG